MSQTPPYTPVCEVSSATFEDTKSSSGTSMSCLGTDLITVDTTNANTTETAEHYYNSPTSPSSQKFDSSHVLSNILDTRPQIPKHFIGVPRTQVDLKSLTPYKLKSKSLENFVLSSAVFEIKLDRLLGKGSNSYVHLATLSTREAKNMAMQFAIKIPTAKNKVKLIEKETEFLLLLKDYRDNTWYRKYGDKPFPFVEAYGLYYLDKTQFPMIKKTDLLPCLLLKNSDTDLFRFINERREITDAYEPAVGLTSWFCLFNFLLNVLQVLQDLEAVHCDIKTDNILVEDVSAPVPVFKLIDFTSSARITDIHEQPEMTLQFTAPELLKDQRKLPDFSTDLYSAGLVLLHAATGSAPYHGYDYDPYYLITLVKEGKVLELLTREESNRMMGNPQVREILKLILVKRCTLEELLTLHT
ncbi:hypothetical protein KL933_001706 [Ogataea haglerorum]|uniref:Protein kinase domain-containing protein n=1 Tax=Ogataea haglerorum TaxID=1937702 RepID=A0AAN6I1R5_9ASCO|nr:uncharacterized protein KL911_000338 [Ogataea haglerorum]KAG7699156.1 hypothetical protein KL915_001448 [Ogataea haglerorum]KAG7700758.1 hypothetical protein KL951_000873 [Ogataea haglerorum]KAG7728473.1 hypothetical protein KL933_001706 [Ogataea haglerorum]KAG7748317.1 hypothetical protein KL912_002222 [Ogataea haglerorum]KAG7759201.1 hypothetical protein KL911_000338 [Ogataea haglerorum]